MKGCLRRNRSFLCLLIGLLLLCFWTPACSSGFRMAPARPIYPDQDRWPDRDRWDPNASHRAYLSLSGLERKHNLGATLSCTLPADLFVPSSFLTPSLPYPKEEGEENAAG